MTGVGTQTLPDLTGQVAFDQGGYEVGTVVGVYLDDDTGQPEWAAVDLDGSELTLVPLAGATPTAGGVQLALGWEDIEEAPYRASELPRSVADDDEAELYRYYRLQPSPRRRRRRRAPPSTSSAARGASREVASSAAEQGQQVASAAADEGQKVARAAAQQARDVAGTAQEEAAQLSEQARSLLDETKGQLGEQAQAQVEGLSESLRRFAAQGQALAEGRPSQAGPLPHYLREAAGRVEQLADEIDARGVDGLVEDLQSFARRRPGVFLLGAAAVGFGVGRLVRAKSSDGDEAAVR
jgi:ElaB/YqjD/DUF883 family membrane-anchored ribosome-binding protein